LILLGILNIHLFQYNIHPVTEGVNMRKNSVFLEIALPVAQLALTMTHNALQIREFRK
jgi:hypothetical protein